MVSDTTTSQCKALGRTTESTPVYQYPCNAINFADGKYYECEVGDLSGKFGDIKPLAGVSNFGNENLREDPLPPYDVDYDLPAADSLLSHAWKSIVFHKITGERFFCAKLNEVDTSACDVAGLYRTALEPTAQPTTQGPTLYTEDDVKKWVIYSIIGTIILNVALYFICGLLDCLTCRNRKTVIKKKTIVKNGKGDNDRIQLTAAERQL